MTSRAWNRQCLEVHGVQGAIGNQHNRPPGRQEWLDRRDDGGKERVAGSRRHCERIGHAIDEQTLVIRNERFDSGCRR